MLDLNIDVDVISVHSFSGENSDDYRNLFNPMDNHFTQSTSGTSISSVLNEAPPAYAAGDTDDSGSTFNSFIESTNSVQSTELVTRQFFPVTSIGSSVTSLLRPSQRLNLPNSDGQQLIAFGQQRAPPDQPQARRRRRGPKSQSSEFRGVTFYRRTGRWESHIWYK